MNRWMLTTVLAAAALGGCIERELTITSEPSGALVYVSDIEVGRTPLTMEFTWYGDYDIILRKDGYETLKTHSNLRPRWYAYPPLDFFSELAPWTCRDERFLHFTMTPAEAPDNSTLMDRARELKEKTIGPIER